MKTHISYLLIAAASLLGIGLTMLEGAPPEQAKSRDKILKTTDGASILAKFDGKGYTAQAAGSKTPIPDGTYKLTNGKTLRVKGGRIIGEEGVIGEDGVIGEEGVVAGKVAKDKILMTKDGEKVAKDKVLMTKDAEKVAKDKILMTKDGEKVAKDKILLSKDGEKIAKDKLLMTKDGEKIAKDKLLLSKDAAVGKDKLPVIESPRDAASREVPPR